MANKGTLTIQQLTVDNVSWTTVRAPKACNSVSFYETSAAVAIKRRTDSADATTEAQSAAGIGWVIEHGPVSGTVGVNGTFVQNEILCYLQAASGTVTVVAEWI